MKTEGADPGPSVTSLPGSTIDMSASVPRHEFIVQATRYPDHPCSETGSWVAIDTFPPPRP
ncbi:hypothetical protein QLH51_05810, partial [Sphingomonas sp. 2R-10]|uniref:hypothetical protein n=1 Tax=Sphingomonas sp. 2R-10 TaxID=3045148 RepID=UPI0024BB92EC